MKPTCITLFAGGGLKTLGAMATGCLARFQSMPDSYILPERKSLAATIIGNGVPCVMAQRICEAFFQGE